MAGENSADPDQTAPERAWKSSQIRVYTVCYSTTYFKKQLFKKKKKKKKKAKIVWNKMFEILGYLTYSIIKGLLCMM